MTDPATSKSGVALNVPTHTTAPVEGVLCTEEFCRSRPRGARKFAREPKSWSSAPSVAAMTTEVPERELDDLWDDGEFVQSWVRRSRDRPPAYFLALCAFFVLQIATGICLALDKP